MPNLNKVPEAMGLEALKEVTIISNKSDIVVEENQTKEFFDNGQGVHLTVKESSAVKYVIFSNNSYERIFDVYGEIEIIEINTKGVNGNLVINLLNENARANVRTLSVISGENCNLAQAIYHKSPKTFSEIKNVGVALNGAKIMFDTTGKIEKGMGASKCAQLSRGIVMDDISEVSSKPILLIDEFDCFANHGAAIGKMSDEDLFYLMSRGLSKKDAFLLILKGIISPFMDAMPNEEIKENIMTDINSLIVSD